MTTYITRLSHVRFEKKEKEKGRDKLIMTSERNGFQIKQPWPKEWSLDDDDLVSKLHERHYLRFKVAFENAG